MNKPVPSGIRLSPDLRKKLKRIAVEREWSMNTLIQAMLDVFEKADKK